MLAAPARVASYLVLFVAMTATAFAGEAGGMDARTVIQRQLDAFQRGDAEGAYALTSPDLKAAYSNPFSFMDQVRSGNTPFFHRRITEFEDFVLNGDRAAQSVVVVDDDSDVWNVVYKLSRQPDGSWLIDGVILAKSDATDA
jgi:hypothetical protein